MPRQFFLVHETILRNLPVKEHSGWEHARPTFAFEQALSMYSMVLGYLAQLLVQIRYDLDI